MELWDYPLAAATVAAVVLMFCLAYRFIVRSGTDVHEKEISELRLEIAELRQFYDGTLKRWQAEKKNLDKQREKLAEKEKALTETDGESGGNGDPGRAYDKNYWAERARKAGLMQ